MKFASELENLQAFHGREFLDAAYKLLLGRQIDDTGCNYYLKKLQLGASRTSIIVAIGRSAEFQQRRDLDGALRETVAKEVRANHWFFRLFHSSRERDRALYQLQFELARIIAYQQSREAEITSMLARMSAAGEGVRSPTMLHAPHDEVNTATVRMQVERAQPIDQRSQAAVITLLNLVGFKKIELGSEGCD